MTLTEIWFFVIILGLLAYIFWMEVSFARYDKKRKEERDRRKHICDYRDNLLATMRDNDYSNGRYLESIISTPQFRNILSQYKEKTNHAFKVWEGIEFNTIMDSGKPVEDFYPQEVLDELIWKYDIPNKQVIH